MSKTTVILVEDDEELRERIAGLLDRDPSFALLASVGTVSDGIRALDQHKPDVLLADLGLPDGSGVDIIRAIQKNQLDTLSMVISGFQDEHRVYAALEAGADAYLLKHDKNQKITEAIRSMQGGGAPISPVIARLMLSKFQRPVEPKHPTGETLTLRQIKILKLVSQGFSSREISEKLDISYYTVTTHIKNIYNKLQVNSRTEALFEAREQGLF